MAQSPELVEAYRLIKAGQRDEAAQIITRCLSQNQNDPNAWWLLAHTVTEPEKIEHCLKNVLKFNPQHVQAQEKLAKLQTAHASAPPPFDPFVNKNDEFGDPFEELERFQSPIPATSSQPPRSASKIPAPRSASTIPAPRSASKLPASRSASRAPAAPNENQVSLEKTVGVISVIVAMGVLLMAGIWISNKQGWFGPGPKSVVEDFYKAIPKKDAEKIYEYSCVKSSKGITRVKTAFDAIESIHIDKLDITEMKKTGDTAQYEVGVRFKTVNKDGSWVEFGHIIYLDLKKQDGHWCIVFDNPNGISTPLDVLSS
jgi:hypothetical protein